MAFATRMRKGATAAAPRAGLTPCFAAALLFLSGQSALAQQASSEDMGSRIAAAQKAQSQGDFISAAADYQRALKLHPEIAELRANLGLMEHEAGQYADAIQSFEGALRLKPSLYVPNLFLGIDYVRTGRAKEAIPVLLKAQQLNPDDPLPPLTLGRAWCSLGNYYDAAAAFRRSLHIDPKQSSAWFGMGIVYLDEVEADARALTGKYGDSSYASALFAESLVNQSRFREAASSYKTILADRDQPPCMLAEAAFVALRQGNTNDVVSQLSREQSEHPECSLAVLGEARLRLEAGDNQAAMLRLEKLWELDHGFVAVNAPLLTDGASADRVQAWLAYLGERHASEDSDPALYAILTQRSGGEIYSSATTAHSQAVELTQAAEAYRTGRYAMCADLLEPALHNGTAAALRMLSACSFFTGNYTLTAEAANALRSLPSRPEAEALYWSIKANEKLAFTSLARFQQLEPDSARSHILLGDIDRQRKRYGDAQKEYAQALGLSPGNMAALLGLATAYYGDGNFAKTIETAQQALTQSPDDPEVNLLIGEALILSHNYADAEPYLQKALNAKPQMLTHVHALLGEVYAEKGATEDAIRELKMGAASDQDGSVHYRLARLYSKIGDRADAEIALQQTKSLQQKQREHAVIAIQDPQSTSLDSSP